VFTIILLVTLIAVSLVLAANPFSRQAHAREFYVGVEDAYSSQASGVKALADKVKDFTNLFVIGSVDITFNRTALDEACDYVFNCGLNFIILFTSRTSYNYSIMDWMINAQQKYNGRFLGIYKIDEPGGNQLDKGQSMLINSSSCYTQVSQDYVGNLSTMINYYYNYTPRVFTADYALNWFDYKANYTAIFAEFVGNESRQRIIALDRGAAKVFNKDWGVIINWKYDGPPYLETANELYADLSLAYSAGAKYAFVFSYPNVTGDGTLTKDHFDTLRTFWNTLHNNPNTFGSSKPQVAYIMPKDYGFGFRNPNDTIWGLFAADETSAKIYNDVETLTQRYDSRLDILYDEPGQIEPLLGSYDQVHYWNQKTT
jgi:hypothetical protein